MRSAIYEEGTNTSWQTNLDLSGVQTGSRILLVLDLTPAAAVAPSNNYLSWRTSSLVDAQSGAAGQSGTDVAREGGYYCGTQISAIEIKDINLTNYRDVSNNTNTRGYRAVIYQN